ncbi:MAG: hypothetical protein KGD64_09580, partial [Candidatus Heimdallarchaeota archaeon]|nr:hypothetical protein [Candidatus Heimdallarchaeota archaeon]
IMQELAGRLSYLTNYERIIESIYNLSTSIQIPLSRIAEDSQLPIQIVKSFLKNIVRSQPELGDLLEVEGIFIRHSDTKPTILQSQTKKEMKCLFCESEFKIDIDQENRHANCPNCDEKIPICEICRSHLTLGEKIVQSSTCNHVYHKDHILEWIKIKSNCPVCKEPLVEKNLKPYPT